jgi:hypothetical protein
LSEVWTGAPKQRIDPDSKHSPDYFKKLLEHGDHGFVFYDDRHNRHRELMNGNVLRSNASLIFNTLTLDK